MHHYHGVSFSAMEQYSEMGSNSILFSKTPLQVATAAVQGTGTREETAWSVLTNGRRESVGMTLVGLSADRPGGLLKRPSRNRLPLHGTSTDSRTRRFQLFGTVVFLGEIALSASGRSIMYAR